MLQQPAAQEITDFLPCGQPVAPSPAPNYGKRSIGSFGVLRKHTPETAAPTTLSKLRP